MMKKKLLALGIALLCLLLQATAAETVRYTMKYKGEVRTYWLYVPEGADASTPLVLVLHGYGDCIGLTTWCSGGRWGNRRRSSAGSSGGWETWLSSSP